MDNNYNEIIGQRINAALALSNIKQKELAKELGVKDNVVSYWCSGKRTPNTEQIIKISKMLNISSDYLLGLSDAATSDKNLQSVCDYVGLRISTIKKLHYLSKHNILQCDKENFTYYYEELSDDEFEELQKAKLDINKTYQDLRLSEFLNYLLQYLVNNAQTLLDTMQLIDKLHTIKETKKDKTNINANLYELTTKYTMLLHSVLGIDDMFRD
jgi:transcriptional regulator with XRE-family HTH domain